MRAEAADYSDGHVFDVDVCIIGGGPAGLTLANELVGTNVRVLLLERGGLPGRPQGPGPSRFEDGGSSFHLPPFIAPRLGGAANEWMVSMPWNRRGVRMIPLAPDDFESRDWVPHSGWPISRSDLDPYYARSHDELGLGAFDERVERWTTSAHQPLPLAAHGWQTRIERFADPATFTKRINERLRAADNVNVLLHASGGMLDTGEDGERVDRLAIDAGTPARLEARATTFVLAGGGLENAAMLLRSRNGRGVGNDHDTVGRYFIDHIRSVPGFLEPSATRPVSSYGLYDFRQHEGQLVAAKIALTAEAQAEERVMGGAIQFMPKPSVDVTHALSDTRAYLDNLKRRRPTRPPIGSLLRTMGYVGRLAPEMSVRQRRFPPRANAGWSDLCGSDRHYKRFEIDLQTGLAPDPSNRITLSRSAVDDMGRPVQRIRWKWTEADRRNVHRMRDLFAEAVARAGIGSLTRLPWDNGMPELRTPGGAYHPSGSTRMSASQRSGVVDAACRVHGEPSVAILGSSVFPTSGYENPTLTIMALAIRLADALKRIA